MMKPEIQARGEGWPRSQPKIASESSSVCGHTNPHLVLQITPAPSEPHEVELGKWGPHPDR